MELAPELASRWSSRRSWPHAGARAGAGLTPELAPELVSLPRQPATALSRGEAGPPGEEAEPSRRGGRALHERRPEQRRRASRRGGRSAQGSLRRPLLPSRRARDRAHLPRLACRCAAQVPPRCSVELIMSYGLVFPCLAATPLC
jgi:hypothetical protein